MRAKTAQNECPKKGGIEEKRQGRGGWRVGAGCRDGEAVYECCRGREAG